MDRDKFLTEAMGECWHEWEKPGHFLSGCFCKHCGRYWPINPSPEAAAIIQDCKLSTWPGFGKLWEWAQEQEWWSGFREGKLESDWGMIMQGFIHPDRFANAVYEFLRGLE